MDNAIIFIHSGMYLTEYLFVDTNVTMIGAAPGNVIDNVIIERGTESTITFVEGAKEAYLGYVTLKVSVLDICCFLTKVKGWKQLFWLWYVCVTLAATFVITFKKICKHYKWVLVNHVKYPLIQCALEHSWLFFSIFAWKKNIKRKMSLAIYLLLAF